MLGKEKSSDFHSIKNMHLQNNESSIRMALLSNKGKAQLCNREMESFTLANMFVE